MEKIITYSTLSQFAYVNDRLLKGPARGIVVSFFGLGATTMLNEDPADAAELAEQGILYFIPYLNPWAWMNRQAVDYTDEILDLLLERYGKDLEVCSTGGSMGGQSALTFCAYTKHKVCSCVVNCPVCDLPYHFTERPDLPRTLYSALGTEEMTLAEALKSRSPLHLVDRLPKIPYHFFHCTADEAVNKGLHSDKMTRGLTEAGFDVTYEAVPDRGHCQLTPEAHDRYVGFMKEAFRG